MIITVSESYIPVRHVQIDTLDNPLTGQKETLFLVLYQKRINTNFSTTLKKKLTGLYSDADGVEIASRYWTREMKDTFIKEQQALTDLSFGTKLQWPAWIFIGIMVISFIALGNEIYKTVSGAKPKGEVTMAELRSDLKVGDELFGWYLKDAKRLYGWVKIVEMNGDRFGILLSKDMGDKGTPNASKYGRDDYNKDILLVNANLHNSSFTIVSDDYKFYFSVIENR